MPHVSSSLTTCSYLASQRPYPSMHRGNTGEENSLDRLVVSLFVGLGTCAGVKIRSAQQTTVQFMLTGGLVNDAAVYKESFSHRGKVLQLLGGQPGPVNRLLILIIYRGHLITRGLFLFSLSLSLFEQLLVL